MRKTQRYGAGEYGLQTSRHESSLSIRRNPAPNPLIESAASIQPARASTSCQRQPGYTGVVLRARGLPILLALALALPAATSRKSPPKPARQSGFVRRWMQTLNVREKVAPLIFIPFHRAAPNTRSREYRQFMKLVRETRVGGMVLVN